MQHTAARKGTCAKALLQCSGAPEAARRRARAKEKRRLEQQGAICVRCSFAARVFGTEGRVGGAAHGARGLQVRAHSRMSPGKGARAFKV